MVNQQNIGEDWLPKSSKEVTGQFVLACALSVLGSLLSSITQAAEMPCPQRWIEEPFSTAVVATFGWQCVNNYEDRKEICIPQGSVIKTFSLEDENKQNVLGSAQIHKTNDRCVEAVVHFHSSDHTGANGLYICSPAAYQATIRVGYCHVE